jgi:hypothetical protein
MEKGTSSWECGKCERNGGFSAAFLLFYLFGKN